MPLRLAIKRKLAQRSERVKYVDLHSTEPCVDSHKLEELLRISFPSHRPSCLETSEPFDIEHHIVYNAFSVGQVDLIALEKALKETMVPVGIAREILYLSRHILGGKYLYLRWRQQLWNQCFRSYIPIILTWIVGGIFCY